MLLLPQWYQSCDKFLISYGTSRMTYRNPIPQQRHSLFLQSLSAGYAHDANAHDHTRNGNEYHVRSALAVPCVLFDTLYEMLNRLGKMKEA